MFTGYFSAKKPGEYLYLTMSKDPLGPGGSHTRHRERPSYEHLGYEIKFQDLPEGCRRLVLDTYERLWDL